MKSNEKVNLPPSFAGRVKEVVRLVRDFTPSARVELYHLLSLIATSNLGSPSSVKLYHDSLLFLSAYPTTTHEHNTATRELIRIVQHVADVSNDDPSAFANSGIGGSETTAPFSHEVSRSLVNSGASVSVNQDELDGRAIVKAVMPTLDPVEYEMLAGGEVDWTPYGPADERLYSHEVLRWLTATVDQNRLDTRGSEDLFSTLCANVTWSSSTTDPSIATSRAPIKKLATHKELQGRGSTVKFKQLRIRLSKEQTRFVVEAARGVLCHFQRETDPTTYTQFDGVEYYECGRGLSVALFPMQSDMKMAVQSYVGHMVFKNGVPVAYGGTWLLFNEAGFGVNIFPAFRGGESALVVSALLDLYKSIFTIKSFTVDPYQIGSGNPDGIKSGAFWFYYRLGFRPEESHLRDLAKAEAHIIATEHGYRTSAKTLRVLAGSTMRWNVSKTEKPKPINAPRLADVVSSYVQLNHAGDRRIATAAAIRGIAKKIGKPLTVKHSIAPIALLLQASNYVAESTKSELSRFVRCYEYKSTDETRYVRESQSFSRLVDCLRSAERQFLTDTDKNV